jgi:hypothetical protein
MLRSDGPLYLCSIYANYYMGTRGRGEASGTHVRGQYRDRFIVALGSLYPYLLPPTDHGAWQTTLAYL